jgi:surfactin synthase thioesterase subunit
LTLVCFPHAGGTANYYRNWAQAFPGFAELLVVQYPGREDRLGDALIDDMRELADAVAEDVLAKVRGPVALFGHSMGSLVAFEVAVRMRAAGREPTHLAASGQHAPGLRRPTSLHLASDDELLADITELGGTSDELRRFPELLEMVLPVVRNDYKVIETYRPTSSTLSCPVTGLHSVGDRDVGAEGVQRWRERTTGDFARHVFPGDHFYVNDHRDALLGVLADRVTR